MKKKSITKYLFKIGTALYIIGTSIFDIIKDITGIKKEHGLLIIGVVSLIVTISEMRKESKELQYTLISSGLGKKFMKLKQKK